MAQRINTPAARGKAAELRAMAWLIEGGFEVMIPAGDDSRVDVVYRRVSDDGMHGPWRSAQIKRVYWKKGFPTVNLVRASGDRYDAIDADYLFAVDGSKMWAVPFHRVCHLSRMRLTAKHDQYVKVLV
jgi:hypothetical protein